MSFTARFLATAAIVATIIVPGQAASLAFRVTPVNMANFSAEFAVSTKTNDRGTEYEIIVTRKTLEPIRFARPTQGQVVRINQTGDTFAFEGLRAVKVKRIGRDQLSFRFMATPEEVASQSFELGFPTYTTINGKLQWLPSSEFFYLNLRDFAPKQ